MTKAAEMARVSAKGGFHYLWGLVGSTVISAIGTIFIARLLGPDNMGLYTIALAAPTLIANFRDWGINTAMTRYTAQYNAEKNSSKIKNVIVAGIVFEIVLGLTLALIAMFLSGFLAELYQRPAISGLIQIASITVLTGALTAAVSSTFVGLESMHLNSIMLIIQSIVKTGVIIGLVLLGFGTLGAVVGSVTSILIAGLAGLTLLWTLYKSLPKSTASALELKSTMKTMLRYGIPLSIGVILAGLLTQFYNNIMVIFVTDNAAIGNYSVALNFVILITFFATPVTTMLLPAFSKLNFQKDKTLLKSVFQYSVKYAALIVVPVTAMIMALAEPAIRTIYSDQYVQAPQFLALSAIIYLFSAMGSLSVTNLINSQGYTRYNLKLTILQVSIGFPLSFIMISQFGVIGLIVTSTVVSVPTWVLGLRFIKKRFDVSIDWVSSSKILFSSAIAALSTYLVISQLTVNSLIQLLTGAILFTTVFVLTAVISRTISSEDIGYIREIVNGLGPLSKPLNFLVNILDKLMSVIKY